MTRHPTPSTLAREAYPPKPDDTPTDFLRKHDHAKAYASAIAAERARVAAWLAREASAIRARGTQMDIVAAVALETAAAQLEGRAPPR